MKRKSSFDQSKIDLAVEQVCQKGCAEVNRIIDKLQEGGIPRSASALNKLEKEQYIRELQSIMKVYD